MTLENAADVLKLIDKYYVPCNYMIEKFFNRIVTAENVCLCLELTLLFPNAFSQKFRDQCNQIICANSKEILYSTDFQLINQETAKIILDMDGMKSSEMEIFNAAAGWSKASLERKNLGLSVENVTAELKNICGSIRFPTMKIHEFTGIMGEYPNLMDITVVLDTINYITLTNPFSHTEAKLFKTKQRLPLSDNDSIEPLNVNSFELRSSGNWSSKLILVVRSPKFKIALISFETMVQLPYERPYPFIERNINIENCTVDLDGIVSPCQMIFDSISDIYLKITCNLDSPIPVICDGQQSNHLEAVLHTWNDKFMSSQDCSDFICTFENGIEIDCLQNGNNFINKLQFTIAD